MVIKFSLIFLLYFLYSKSFAITVLIWIIIYLIIKYERMTIWNNTRPKFGLGGGKY